MGSLGWSRSRASVLGCRVRRSTGFGGYGELMSDLERPGTDPPPVEGDGGDRGPIIVVTAISMKRAAREALAARLGPGHIVRDIKEAGNTADIVLVPSVSGMLVGGLRAMFPGAKVLVTELVDDEFGIDFAGPVTRTVSSGVDGYFVVPDLSQLASIAREAGRATAGALSSGAGAGGLLALTAHEGAGGTAPEVPDRSADHEAAAGESSGHLASGHSASGHSASGESAPAVLVLSGPPGAGKTAVAWQVFRLWTAAGLDPAMVDLDLLGAAWPAPSDDPHQSRLKAANLAAVWANYRATGSRRLVVAAVVESEDELSLLTEAVGSSIIVCRLHATPEVLAERITARSRETGGDLSKLIRRASELSSLLASQDVSDFVLDTDHRTIDDVADQVILSLSHPVLSGEQTAV